MAKQIVVVDDITGDLDADTITFGWADRVYNIDLTAEGRAELDAVLRAYIRFAQDVGRMTITEEKRRRQPMERRHPESGRHTKEEVVAVRTWAEQLGIEMPYARVPNDMWAAWRANDTSLLLPGRLPDSELSARQQKLQETLSRAG